MRILIAGAGGQLGHDLMDGLHDQALYGFDHRELDIADPKAVRSAVESIRPDWIINAAAYNNVDAAEDNHDLAFKVNASGAGNLADSARAIHAGIVHISTDYVFDGRKGSGYSEEDDANPLSVYGHSKYEGERNVLSSGASACVLRTAWLYGQHGSNFVKAIRAAAKSGKPLEVVADQVGSPTWTMDLAQAIAEFLVRPVPGIYHVVNQGACSRFEFARAIVRGNVPVLPISSAQAKRRAERPANSSLAGTRWKQAGFTALRPWQDALAEFLRTSESVPA
jgi:dTDP-4-dehydrorhamnose reductase